MPRSSSRRSAPAPAPQRRQASTYAAPPRAAPPPPAPTPAAHAPAQPPMVAPQQPSLFGQMASTAAGVAVGSTVGHALGGALGGIFGGSSSSAPVESAPAAVPAAAQQSYSQPAEARACDVDARAFTKCLDDNQGNMQICEWYLQQLKACQEAARPY
ncbi:uncharacterized protein V1510DRAFT_405749 [Dipodascopsis tothii]|uniref:uncharacterized protein n=1 Tax=Dipodascopsis tothii TaxID=44089 RepID=UPI0034D01DA2